MKKNINNIININDEKYLRNLSSQLEDWCWEEKGRIRDVEVFVGRVGVQKMMERLKEKERRLETIEDRWLKINTITREA